MTGWAIKTELLTAEPGVGLQGFDSDGFLIDSDIWTRTLAGFIAEDEDVGPLNDAHWRIIDFVRQGYFQIGALPPVRRICRETGLERDAVKGLFGGCRNLWRIAGLPHPGDEATTYMD